MSQPETPEQRNSGLFIPLQNLRDLALDDSEHSFYAPRGGDYAILGLVVATLLATGLLAWHQLAAQSSGAGWHAGRAIFFGFLLISLYWAAILYAFKLSVGIRLGPGGMSVLRGPWQTELRWREVARLVERTQMVDGQRLRWVVALARDGRRLQIREDMVGDYLGFRKEIYDRYRLWRDHGGTWGATGGGPFVARETISTQVSWWGALAGLVILPGLYFLVLLPETGLVGPLLLTAGIICAFLSLWALARRQTYRVDAKAIASSRLMGTTVHLPWREVARVDRSRHPWSGIIQTGIVVGRLGLKLAMRNEKRMRSFDWSPRIPEYLTLRGAGHQVRIKLHRLARPDELLAWVEFYERVGRRVVAAESGVRRKSTSAKITRDVEPETTQTETAPPANIPHSGGPFDPWANDVTGAPTVQLPEQPRVAAQPQASAAADAWLRDETGALDGIAARAEEAPTQEVPAVTFQAYLERDTPESFTRHAAHEDLHDFVDLEDLDDLGDVPTAKMEAVAPVPQAGPPTPPLGSPVPVSHSLDQLWAPAEREESELPEAPPERPTSPDNEQEMAVETSTARRDLFERFAPKSRPTRHGTDTSGDWQPPILPRYGPPLDSQPANHTSGEQHYDDSSHGEDDFLR